ncbi:MAG: Alpha-D-kanosaminyltransferase [Pelotomaculum sp. PtaB.Bin117]|nr:MAG: Alpha-D-kanosaminyltransferase [Pelotomaculum sp. PtaB.Bin117]
MKPYLPSGAKIYYVNNPIEIPRDKPVPVQDNKKFIMVGRLSKEKGPHLLAMASRMLGCECIFVGDGDCRSDIEKILPGTQITGWLSYQEVQNYLQTARALVLPSLLYETQGLVVAEAAAMGIPAVVPDTSAARDMVVNGLTGLWFRGGSVADLAKKIAVLQDAETARKMGQAAYERYWSNPYTMDAHINKLLEVYEKILSS